MKSWSLIAAYSRAPQVSRVWSWATFIFLLPSATLHPQDLPTRTDASCCPTATLAALLYLPESQLRGGSLCYTGSPSMRQLGPFSGMDLPRGLFFSFKYHFHVITVSLPFESWHKSSGPENTMECWVCKISPKQLVDKAKLSLLPTAVRVLVLRVSQLLRVRRAKEIHLVRFWSLT